VPQGTSYQICVFRRAIPLEGKAGGPDAEMHRGKERACLVGALQQTLYLPLVGRSGVAFATLGWGLASPHPARLRKRATLPVKGRDGVRGDASSVMTR